MRILIRLLVLGAYGALIAGYYAVKNAHVTGQHAQAMHAAAQFFANPVAIGLVCLALAVVLRLTFRKSGSQQQGRQSQPTHSYSYSGRK